MNNHYFIMSECVSNRHKRVKFFLFHIIDACNDIFTSPVRSDKKRRLYYGLGRVSGLVKCIVNPPRMTVDDPAQINRKSLQHMASQ